MPEDCKQFNPFGNCDELFCVLLKHFHGFAPWPLKYMAHMGMKATGHALCCQTTHNKTLDATCVILVCIFKGCNGTSSTQKKTTPQSQPLIPIDPGSLIYH